MKEEDFIKEAESVTEEDLQKGNGSPHRILAFFGGIILVILLVSYVFVTYPVSAIIEGKLESEVLSENMLDLGDIEIIFSDESYDDLREMYFDEMEVEFSVCLLGEKVGRVYNIDSLYQPEMYEQAFNRVVFDPCSSNTLLILHTHPYKRCVASQTDLKMLERSKSRNPDVLMVVMCEEDRFSVYS